ncbi:hypothetical protein O3Q51_11780 [Cryomorphaceae bacterium 1068]|nr:hypothetical protein [Cryomorphaceae bacterium 1068]
MKVIFSNSISPFSKEIRQVGLLLITIVLFSSCKDHADKESINSKLSNSASIFSTDFYELHKSDNEEAVLILYPGAGTTSVETKQEFDILKKAKAKNISVLLMNFTNHLWIDKIERKALTEELEKAFTEHELKRDNIYIGGMSVGGTIALSLSDHLIGTSSTLSPKGVFIVDSPIDLYALYESAQKDLLRDDFSEERLAEPRFIIRYFEEEFGKMDSLVSNIENVSPFIYKLNRNSVSKLKETKLRFYTEPDSLWWRENRDTDFENTNSFVILQITDQLNSAGWEHVELVETKGKGYRANGDRHPHSWSIVDVDNLIDWILE